MADAKISDLTAASAAAGANEVPINEAGTTKKLTVAQMAAFIAGSGWQPAGETLTCGVTDVLTGSTAFVANLSLGDKIWIIDDETAWMGYVISKPSSTTFGIKGGSTSGVAASIAANSTLTVPYYSKVSSPTGFPQWFSLAAPTWTVAHFDNGAGGQPTTTEFRFKIQGRQLYAHCKANGTKAQTNNVILFATSSFPVAPANTTNQTPLGTGYCDVVNQTATIFQVDASMYIQFPANITDNATLGQVNFQVSFEI